MTAPKKSAAAKKAPAKTSAATRAPSPPRDTEVAADPSLTAGQLAAFTYFDASVGAGGQDVTRVGIVVSVDGGKARMAWLDDVSHPVPVDDLESL